MLLKNTSVPKRKQVQNKVKQTFEEEKTSVPKKMLLKKTLIYCQNEVT